MPIAWEPRPSIRPATSAAVPYRVASNQAFLESGKALAWCLKRLKKLDLATEVVEQLLRFDPEDTLAVSGILSDDSASG